MDAADSPGAEKSNPGQGARRQRPAHRSSAKHALGDADGEVTGSRLACRIARSGETLELVCRESDSHAPFEDTHRGRHRAGFADPPLGLERDVEPFAGGKTVGDERRLERDDGSPGIERVAHLRRELDHGVAPRFATHRAAVASASSTPPTR